jgi:hypothetical protein
LSPCKIRIKYEEYASYYLPKNEDNVRL